MEREHTPYMKTSWKKESDFKGNLMYDSWIKRRRCVQVTVLLSEWIHLKIIFSNVFRFLLKGTKLQSWWPFCSYSLFSSIGPGMMTVRDTSTDVTDDETLLLHCEQRCEEHDVNVGHMCAVRSGQSASSRVTRPSCEHCEVPAPETSRSLEGKSIMARVQ